MRGRPLLAVTLAVCTLATLALLAPLIKASRSGSPQSVAVPVDAGNALPVGSEADDATSPPPQPAAAATHSHREIDEQDDYNGTRAFQRYIGRQQREHPAYQHLPYRTDQVLIEIANVTADGRVVLTVTPRTLQVNPRAAYRQFLRRYHDPGSFYVAQYGRFGS